MMGNSKEIIAIEEYTPERDSAYPAGMNEILEELQRISNRLDVALTEGDNPISMKCQLVLDATPRCYDFSGSRRFSACRAWEIMETEKVSWQEAITRAWKELKEKCVWD